MSDVIANKNIDNFDEEISIYDIWNKLVQYKLVFWIIFLVIFTIGITGILLVPKKYNFSQLIEVGKYVDSRGYDIKVESLGDATIRMKRVLIPKAVHMNQLSSKVIKNILVEKGSDNSGNDNSGILMLSIQGVLSDKSVYKAVFQQIIDELANATKSKIDHRIEFLNINKTSLEVALAELSKKGKKEAARRVEDDNINRTFLANDLDKVQLQINGTYNTKAIYSFMVSDEPIGPSKLLQLILVIMVSLFCAFFGVFIANATVCKKCL